MGEAPADMSRYQVLCKSDCRCRRQDGRGSVGAGAAAALRLCKGAAGVIVIWWWWWWCGEEVGEGVGGVVKPRICCAASVFMVCESQRRVKGRADDADRAGLYLGNA